MLWLLLSCVHVPVAPPETPTLEPTAPLQRQGLSSELIIEGPLVERLSPDDGADLVILYGGEERGDDRRAGRVETEPPSSVRHVERAKRHQVPRIVPVGGHDVHRVCAGRRRQPHEDAVLCGSRRWTGASSVAKHGAPRGARAHVA